jgi:hypothetical protein
MSNMNDDEHPIIPALQPLYDDPNAFRQQLDAELRATHGEQWMIDHARELESNWEYARCIFRF